MARNGKLVYGRMTGWGQTGPLAEAVGHDGNYAALAGVIAAIGSPDGPPSIPLNLTADFGGGGAYLAIGLLAALLEAGRSGQGQIVDAAMVDGAASLMTLFYGLHAGGLWQDRRGSNFLDGAAPFYRAYRTRDAQYVMVCAIEPHFFAALLGLLGVDDIEPGRQFDQAVWPALITRFEAIFAARTRDEWCDLLEGSDACFAPVLSLSEAPQHAHNQARATFVEHAGIVQPAPAPRFSRTQSRIRSAPDEGAADLRAVLADWGLSQAAIDKLKGNT
jgi:alpha-methylacyl-CoA racemase